MTKLEETYDILNKENIEVNNIELNEKNNAIIVNYNDKYYIALNKTKLDNTNEYIVLNEELGHYYTNSLYKVYNNPTWIEKCEYRAKKWQISTLIPLDKLRQYIDRTICELADIFEVTVEFMYNAIQFYQERGLLWQEI